MNLQSPLTELKGVGAKTAEKFSVVDIDTIEDLLFTFPRSYTDYSNITTISKLKPGKVTLKVRIHGVNSRYSRRGLHITGAVASDDTGSVSVIWFNQSYRADSIDSDKTYYVSGEYAFSNQRYSLVNPSIEVAAKETKNTARIVPNYSERNGLKSHQIRPLILGLKPLIKNVEETVPDFIKKDYDLEDINDALLNIHFPKTQKSLEAAKRRLGFDEIFEFMLSTQLQKNEIKKMKAHKVQTDVGLAKEFVSSLPFKLTNSQRKVCWQILKEMESGNPMNRLIQGDVGSGKTVIAAMAALMAIRNGYNVFFVAPTEILAKQHHENIKEMLRPFKIKTNLLVGALKSKEKTSAKKTIESGVPSLTIGTHALMQTGVGLGNLGLAIVDEQHRFGVKQRQAILKSKVVPHVLTMSATPIPRSLALTLYGELDISVLDEMPPGRKPVVTKVFSERTRKNVYKKMELLLKQGQQAFVVVPAVEEDNLLSVKNVMAEHKKLSKAFSGFSVGFVHGKLKTEEKDKVMQKFAAGKLDILVSTTVIEVGVDVPNATILLIEAAERFGLAQLHQLRGRVGRSSTQSYCFVAPSPGSPVNERLLALEQTNSGFELAETDLELRGPGQIYGTRQHGILDLKIAKFTDVKLVTMARAAAKSFIDSGQELIQYPRLEKRVNSVRAITNLN